MSVRRAALSAALALIGCADTSDDPPDVCDPTAVEVVAFEPGPGAGFGEADLPQVVLGPPDGGKTSQGSLDVLSLGRGGSITLRLGCVVEDGDGVDFIVYENAFFTTGGAFTEPAEVAVSDDGVTFTTYPCTPSGAVVDEDDGDDGCAGLAPVEANVTNGLTGVFPEGGGDAFDLATIGVSAIEYVRVTDRGGDGAAAPQVGFDLDGVSGRVRD